MAAGQSSSPRAHLACRVAWQMRAGMAGIATRAACYGAGAGGLGRKERGRRGWSWGACFLILALVACGAGRSIGGASPPACQPAEVNRLVSGFLDAFNRGDQEQLARAFPERLEWYSVTDLGPGGHPRHFVTHDRASLLIYFSERRRQNEQLTLRELSVTSDGNGEGAQIVYIIARRADDLPANLGGPEGLAQGKGAVNCRTGTVYVWSLGHGPNAPPGR